jgi:hypothetical protein
MPSRSAPKWFRYEVNPMGYISEIAEESPRRVGPQKPLRHKFECPPGEALEREAAWEARELELRQYLQRQDERKAKAKREGKRRLITYLVASSTSILLFLFLIFLKRLF